MLSEQERREIDAEVAILPERRSAVIEALKTVQRHRGWVSDEAIDDVADYLGMSATEVDSVATFYNLLYRQRVGRHVIHVCDSVSCWILGCEALNQAIEEQLEVEMGGTTGDGKFTLLPIPCLGCCDRAPAMMIDEDLHTGVTAEGLEAIFRRYA